MQDARWLFFDLGNTLIREERGWERRIQRLVSSLERYGRRLLVDESVAQIEEKPKSIPHSELISDFDYAGRPLISDFTNQGPPSAGRNRPVWYQILKRPLCWLLGYARFVNTNQSISSVTASARLILAR